MNKKNSLKNIVEELQIVKTVSNIATELGMRLPNVSREITKHGDMRLVERKYFRSKTKTKRVREYCIYNGGDL